MYPSLAVDLRVLEFVNRLYLRISPNNTALCDTLRDFLKSQGYQLKGQDPLRRRFSNALLWYNSLVQATNDYVDRVVEDSRKSLTDQTLSLSSPGITDNTHSGRDEEHGTKRSRIEEDEPIRHRPSEYLRRRCPLCFGGSSALENELSCIVCLDACFTQKNNTQSYRDPPREHPRTVFISEADVNTWQRFVDSVRPNGTKSQASNLDNDGYEGNLKVPNSVLDGCESSFIAADGARVKASTQFFDSTGLMGLLCR
ncbi:hypothetical protein F5878DRAFT_550007, partial [Lentinula raphanica]